jgi:DNA-binding NarL/FixJ family response regulator
MTIRVLLADDHDILREGLRMLLDLDPELEVVGEAANGVEAVRLAHEVRPDIVLMDLVMPEMDGVAATWAIRRDAPGTEVLALTSVLDDASISGAIEAGAIGYLLKNTHAATLCSAIKAAADGQVQLAPQVAARLIRRAKPAAVPPPLSERETEVLRLIVQGYANKEIARRLKLGTETVKTHVSNLLSKLGVQSRTQAALMAVQLGLMTAGEIGRRPSEPSREEPAPL